MSQKQILRNRIAGFAIAGIGIAVATMALLQRTSSVQAAGRVGPWDAMKSATAKVGGKAIQATYAQEGGTFIYDVVLVKGKTLLEVEVDAATGKVGDRETVTPEMEGKEMVAELHKALGQPVKWDGEKGEKSEKDDKGEAGEKNR